MSSPILDRELLELLVGEGYYFVGSNRFDAYVYWELECHLTKK